MFVAFTSSAIGIKPNFGKERRQTLPGGYGSQWSGGMIDYTALKNFILHPEECVD